MAAAFVHNAILVAIGLAVWVLDLLMRYAYMAGACKGGCCWTSSCATHTWLVRVRGVAAGPPRALRIHGWCV